MAKRLVYALICGAIFFYFLFLLTNLDFLKVT